jgi:hypothetical protein
VNDHGIGQSEFMLFTSFDGAGCYRDWQLNEKWKTKSGWYHCDQVDI